MEEINKMKFFILILTIFGHCDAEFHKRQISFSIVTVDTIAKQKPLEISGELNFTPEFVGGFNATHRTSIIVHGFYSEHGKEMFQEHSKELISKDLNMIFVSWEPAIDRTSLEANQDRIEKVGKSLADFIVGMMAKHPGCNNKMEIVGHGLGAHIASYAADTLKTKHGKITIPKIIALDANRKGVPGTGKLNKESVHDLVAIHTSSHIGIFLSYGTVDIYVNGGKRQPGCPSHLIDFGKCSHNFAYQFYAHIIKSKAQLKGAKCAQVVDELVNVAATCTEEVTVFAAGQNEQKKGAFYISSLSPAANNPNPLNMIGLTKELHKKLNLIDVATKSGQKSKDPYIVCSFHVYPNKNSEIIVHSYDNFELKGDTAQFTNAIKPNRKTVLFIHGMQTITSLKDNLVRAYAKPDGTLDVNLIGVHWEQWIEIGFDVASKQIETVAGHSSKFLGTLNLQNAELVGHDLGCHVSAVVTKQLAKGGKKIGLLVALDPVHSKQYADVENDAELNANNVKKLIVFHASETEGMFDVPNAVNIYLNGGAQQPGCDDSTDLGDCSTMFSHDYYGFIIQSKEPLSMYKSATMGAIKGYRSKFKKSFEADILKNYKPTEVKIFGNVDSLNVANGYYYMSSVYPKVNILPALQRDVEYVPKEYPTEIEGTFDATKHVDIEVHVELPSANGKWKYEAIADHQFYNNATRFDPKKATLIVCHGFMSSGELAWDFGKAYNAIKGAHKYNIIGVNWAKGAASRIGLDYYWVKERVADVGKYVASKLAGGIGQAGKINWNNLQCVGHSLGAHVCANIASSLNGLFPNNPKFPKVIGLDTAGYGIEGKPQFPRLKSGVAQKVVSIHTNGRLFGFWSQVGDLDVYLNGGRTQPHCRNLNFKEVDICSHSFGHEFYNQLLKSNKKLYGKTSKLSNAMFPTLYGKLEKVNDANVELDFLFDHVAPINTADPKLVYEVTTPL